VASEDVCWLHRAASLWAKEALHHEAALEAESIAIVANPVNLRNVLEPEARLMDWYGAAYAKDDLVVVFVVTDTANGAAGTVLGDEGPLLLVHLFDLLLKFHPFGLTIGAMLMPHAFHAIHLIQDLSILHVISSLLSQLELLQKIILELAWVVQVKEELIHILIVPITIMHDVLHKLWIYIAEELLTVLSDLLWLVYGSVSESW